MRRIYFYLTDMNNKQSILLIYTGGTIGMKEDPATGALCPFDFSQVMSEVPELKDMIYRLDVHSFTPLIDSSDVNLQFWQILAGLIRDNYSEYDGFVVLHGTDTMSYSASALSFMLEDLEKPVVFTGSQLPIGKLRTDGKENLISSIEVASALRSDGHPMVPEVCVFFENILYRGNRTTKYSAENFRAFRSANYPPLAEAGIHLKYNTSAIRYPESWGHPLWVNSELDNSVAIIRLVPGFNVNILTAICESAGIRAIVLETYGSGNAPTTEEFLSEIRKATERGVIVMNVSQCQAGCVDMDAYANGQSLKAAGVVSGYDSTTEAAVTKLYFLLGQYPDNGNVKRHLLKNMRGEISIM